MTSAVPSPPSARASLRDWGAVFAAILAAFMAVLDIQVTNASLADIEGAVGASSSEGSWISTAYLSAEIITIPLTGWLAGIVGLRRYLVLNALLFLVFSMWCASASSLDGLIVGRTGQGFSGGVLIPTAVSVLRARLPRAQQPVGISLFGLTATLAPAIGPTLGGWLTELFSWRAIFTVNLVPGAVVLALFARTLEPAPARWRGLAEGDWPGIALMAVGLSSLTIMLEEGQRWTWFGSDLVRVLAAASVVGIVGFVARQFTAARPLINLRLLTTNRTVGSACLLMTVYGAVSLGSIFIIPLYCASVQGYNPQQIGIVVMWSGLPQLVIFPLMPRLIRSVDPRLLVCAGTLCFAASCWINTALTQDVGMDQLVLPQILRAIGQPLVAVPLSQLATAGLAPRDTADASALFSMLRNLGGSLCISMVSTVVERREHLHFDVLAQRLTVDNLRTQAWIGAAAARDAKTAGPGIAHREALAALAAAVRRQATIMSYADAFAIIAIVLVASLAFLVLLRPAKTSPAT